MLRILIVEDVPIAQQMAAMVITSLGCELDIASTGNEAITLFTQHDYNLVFLDIGLPDISGLVVAEKMRELEKKTHTPIIALTAHVSEETKQNSFKSGMDDFISKPLTADKAQEMIDKYTQKPQNTKSL